MYKRDGLWYMADGTLSPSSAAKVNQDTNTPTPAVIIAPMPSEGVTDVSQDRPMVQGVHMYTSKEIIAIESATGLVYAGAFANCDNGKYSGELVPVFLRADHGEEKRKEDLMKIRKGL